MPPAEDDCAVVAFYGIQKDPAGLLRGYRAIVDWFEGLNLSIDKVAVDGKGFSGKQATYSRLQKRIEKDAFRTIDAISLTALSHGSTIPVLHWDATADTSPRRDYTVFAAKTSFVQLSDLALGCVTKQIVDAITPAYGIGYNRLLGLGPVSYAIGLLQHGPQIAIPEDDEDKHRIARWGTGGSLSGMENQVYRDGLLRDVYPFNFLSTPQLDRRVERVPLKKWIAGGKNRGQLQEFSAGLSLWTVNEKHRRGIFEKLWDAGAIFNWRNYL
jgi:hypothetical protein